MKRLTALFLALCLTLTAASCGGSPSGTPAKATATSQSIAPAEVLRDDGGAADQSTDTPAPTAVRQSDDTVRFRDGFDDGIPEGYSLYWEGGEAETSWENGELAVHITDWGSVPHAVQISRSNFRLKGGVTYRLAFDVRSTASRVMDLCVQKQGGDWDVLYQNQAEIGTELRHLEMDFTLEDSVPAQISFNLGFNEYANDMYQEHTVYLDNVELIVVSGDDLAEGQTGAATPRPTATTTPTTTPKPAATPAPTATPTPSTSAISPKGSPVYTSTTNSELKAAVDTATVVVNGTAYTDLPLKMDLDYTEEAGYVKITGIPGDRSIVLNLMLYPDEWKEGLTLTEFTDSTLSFISLYGFYDRELDSSGSNMIWSSTGATTGDYEYWQIFKEAKCVIEKLDSHGITQYYLHVKTKGPTSGKEYDIEALVVRDFTGETAPEFIEGVNDLCVGCHGSGKCSFCSGTGKTRYYNAVTHRTEDKQCYTCKGSGVCSICKGSGKR